MYRFGFACGASADRLQQELPSAILRHAFLFGGRGHSAASGSRFRRERRFA